MGVLLKEGSVFFGWKVSYIKYDGGTSSVACNIKWLDVLEFGGGL